MKPKTQKTGKPSSIKILNPQNIPNPVFTLNLPTLEETGRFAKLCTVENMGPHKKDEAEKIRAWLFTNLAGTTYYDLCVLLSRDI